MQVFQAHGTLGVVRVFGIWVVVYPSAMESFLLPVVWILPVLFGNYGFPLLSPGEFGALAGCVVAALAALNAALIGAQLVAAKRAHTERVGLGLHFGHVSLAWRPAPSWQWRAGSVEVIAFASALALGVTGVASLLVAGSAPPDASFARSLAAWTAGVAASWALFVLVSNYAFSAALFAFGSTRRPVVARRLPAVVVGIGLASLAVAYLPLAGGTPAAVMYFRTVPGTWVCPLLTFAVLRMIVFTAGRAKSAKAGPKSLEPVMMRAAPASSRADAKRAFKDPLVKGVFLIGVDGLPTGWVSRAAFEQLPGFSLERLARPFATHTPCPSAVSAHELPWGFGSANREGLVAVADEAGEVVGVARIGDVWAHVSGRRVESPQAARA